MEKQAWQHLNHDELALQVTYNTETLDALERETTYKFNQITGMIDIQTTSIEKKYNEIKETTNAKINSFMEYYEKEIVEMKKAIQNMNKLQIPNLVHQQGTHHIEAKNEWSNGGSTTAQGPSRDN